MRRFMPYIIIIILLLVMPMLLGWGSYDNGDVFYRVYIGEKPVGLVANPVKGLNLYDKVIKYLRSSTRDEIIIYGDITFIEEVGGTESEAKDLVQNIYDSLDITLVGWAIFADDELICYLKTKDEAVKALEKVKEPYINEITDREDSKLEDIGFKEDVILRQVEVDQAEYVTVYEAVEILEGVSKAYVYTIEKGDSLSTIASDHGITLRYLLELNPKQDGDIIITGNELNVVKKEAPLTILTWESYTYLEALPFERQIKNSNSEYKGYLKVTQEGMAGEKEITAIVSRVNGEWVDSSVMFQQISNEPQNEITVVGTKDKPKVVKRTSSYIPPSSKKGSGSVQKYDWWKTARYMFKRNEVAKVTDVDTGLSFYVKRKGGVNHADVEPLTAADTAIMKKIYKGRWSWIRRAIVVTIDGRKVAASMNGMPHGFQNNYRNKFNGHHCIHFYKSRTHIGNRKDSAHQAMVNKAYRYGR